MYQIYALQDPRDALIYYVGMSSDPQKRLYQHLHRYNSSKREGEWLRELRLLGISPSLLILEKVDSDLDNYYFAQIREHSWIHDLAKSKQPLLNENGLTRPYSYHKRFFCPPSPAMLIQLEHSCSECSSVKRDLAQKLGAMIAVHQPEERKETDCPVSSQVLQQPNPHKVVQPPHQANIMRLQDYRVKIARLTRPELSQLSDVSVATIQRAEKGEAVSELTAAKLLAALFERIGREIKIEEVEDLKTTENK